MSRYVDLDDYSHCFCGHDGEYEKWNIDPDAIIPAIEPERKKGRWLNIDESEKWKCSECGRIMWFSPQLSVKPSDYKFCPNCGAEMKGE